MEFIAFPIRIDRNGWLVRAERPEDGVVQLFRLMAGTSRNGWPGSAEFGLRELLATIQSKHGARLTAIKQMNQVLLDLGINWVKVENIEPEPMDELGKMTYQLTLSYDGGAGEVCRI